jgi:calcium permeable stress-gated cation channel
LLQGLSGTAGGFLQIAPLVMYYIKITLLGSTPRSVYKIKYSPRTSNMGTLFPTITQLVVITLGYSIISPIINGLSFAAFLLFYLLYKYLFTWVNDQPRSSDTGGLFFPKAIQHMFVGLYIQQLCLCALFFLARDDRNSPSAIPEGALMVVLIVLTASLCSDCPKLCSHTGQAFFQNTMLNSYGPLTKFLPLTFADRSYNGGVGTEQEAPMTARLPQPVPPSTSDDVNVIEHHNASASGTGEEIPHARDTDIISQNHIASSSFTNESRTFNPSPFEKPTETQGPTDFTHPAAVEMQRIIWLPQDPLGFVHEIKREFDSRDILHSTEGAKMDTKGRVDVTMAPPEDAGHALNRMGGRPSLDEEEGDDVRAVSLRPETSEDNEV